MLHILGLLEKKVPEYFGLERLGRDGVGWDPNQSCIVDSVDIIT